MAGFPELNYSRGREAAGGPEVEPLWDGEAGRPGWLEHSQLEGLHGKPVQEHVSLCKP